MTFLVKMRTIKKVNNCTYLPDGPNQIKIHLRFVIMMIISELEFLGTASNNFKVNDNECQF